MDPYVVDEHRDLQCNTVLNPVMTPMTTSRKRVAESLDDLFSVLPSRSVHGS